jgi:hypothetical protein
MARKASRKGAEIGEITAFLTAKAREIESRAWRERGVTGGIKEGLGVRAKGREVFANGDVFHLRQRGAGYGDDSCLENDDIGPENEYFWTVFPARSQG